MNVPFKIHTFASYFPCRYHVASSDPGHSKNARTLDCSPPRILRYLARHPSRCPRIRAVTSLTIAHRNRWLSAAVRRTCCNTRARSAWMISGGMARQRATRQIAIPKRVLGIGPTVTYQLITSNTWPSYESADNIFHLNTSLSDPHTSRPRPAAPRRDLL